MTRVLDEAKKQYGDLNGMDAQRLLILVLRRRARSARTRQDPVKNAKAKMSNRTSYLRYKVNHPRPKKSARFLACSSDDPPEESKSTQGSPAGMETEQTPLREALVRRSTAFTDSGSDSDSDETEPEAESEAEDEDRELPAARSSAGERAVPRNAWHVIKEEEEEEETAKEAAKAGAKAADRERPERAAEKRVDGDAAEVTTAKSAETHVVEDDGKPVDPAADLQKDALRRWLDSAEFVELDGCATAANLRERLWGAWSGLTGTEKVRQRNMLASDFTCLLESRRLKRSVVDALLPQLASNAGLLTVDTEQSERIVKLPAGVLLPEHQGAREPPARLVMIFFKPAAEHFVLVRVTGKEVVQYDSLGTRTSGKRTEEMTLAAKYWKSLHPASGRLTSVFQNEPRQRDVVSCGVCVLAEAMRESVEFSWTEANLSFLRLLMLTSFAESLYTSE